MRQRLALLSLPLLTALAPVRLWAQTAPSTIRVRVPDSVHLAYRFEGVISTPYSGSADLLWQREGAQYTSQLTIRVFGLNLQTWTSKGSITEQGLAPQQFRSKRLAQAETSAQFVRPQGTIRFSTNMPEATLQPGAQDQLSVFFQLSSLLAGEPQRWSAGQSIAFQAVSDLYAENWVFRIDAAETIQLPGGTFSAIKLTHEPNAERSQKLELWYVPSMGYLPLRIRIAESNGDFLDLLWTQHQKP